MRTLVATIVFMGMMSGCAARLGRLSDSQKGERLAIEKGRLAQLKDPVQRTKTYITISQLLLEFAVGAARVAAAAACPGRVNGDGISTLELRDSASQLFHPPGDLVSERALQFAVDLRVNFVAADALLVNGTST